MNRIASSVFCNASAISLVMAATAYGDTPPTTASYAPKAAAATATAPVETAPTSPPQSGTLDSFFNGELPDAIGQSQINFQVRPRYEYADTQASKPSQAFTMRTVFGLTTTELYGFQGMIEALNVAALDNTDRYYAGDNGASNGSNQDKTLVLDPPTTEINQVWLSYNYPDWQTGAKGGRQIINLDNQRFIGAVNWRQNPQTFDAVRLDNRSVENLELLFSYIGRVNRVGGNVPNLVAPLKDFQSSSHVFHAHYDAWESARLTGYIYLLDLNNNGVGDVFSSASYGLSVEGAVPVSEEVKLDYRAEAAFQTDYADNPNSYNAPYVHLKVGAAVKPVKFGVGYELLGSDNSVGFQTPLATLHAFNGWADVFLVTPGSGLQDYYAYAQVQLPWQMPLQVAVHKFDAATAGKFNYGNELDIALSRKFGQHWSGLIKYAYYNAHNALSSGGFNSNVHKFWAQVDFEL